MHAKYHKWLEGHEYYDINYETGRVELIEITALCHSCHNFIHSGRLWKLFEKGDNSKDKTKDILLHGFRILKRNNLKPFFGTAYAWLLLQGESESNAAKILKNKGLLPSENEEFADWQDWHLVINGEKHYTKYKDMNAWAETYA